MCRFKNLSKNTDKLWRPEELTKPIHFQVKARYMHLPKKEIQAKINELQADHIYEGYALPKHEFLTILQSLL